MKSSLACLTLLCALVPVCNAASGDQVVDARSEGVEVRTLKPGSAIREAFVKNLGEHRVSADFTVTVVTAGLGLDPRVSVIEALEGAARHKDLFIDPATHPTEPNGPGGSPMIQTTTHAFCALVRGPDGSHTSGNVTWNWTWKPNADTNGDGKINSSDSCPCSWQLDSYSVEYTVQNMPLEC